MQVKTQQLGIYFPLLITSILIVIIALGPGLFHQSFFAGYSWQHRLFDLLCHQDPIRSYSVNGETMAVCARCIGIYGSFASIMVLMPLIPRFIPVINHVFLKLIIVTIVLNIVDVLLNSIGFWTNTLLSRFLLGSIFGASLAAYLTSEFFKQISKEEESYGK